MVTIDKARIARYEMNGNNFEIYVDADLALDVKEGYKKFDDVYNNLLAIEEVYKSAMKGEKAGPGALKDAFGIEDTREIVKEILKNGRLDLTTEQKRKLVENRKMEIVNYIMRNSINPITKAPHTQNNILTAFEKAKIDIDYNKSVSKQVDKIIEKIKPFLPMKFQTNNYRVFVPTSFAGKVNGIINKYDVQERKWGAEGLTCVVKVPAGIKDSFLSTISGITQGNAKVEIED